MPSILFYIFMSFVIALAADLPQSEVRNTNNADLKSHELKSNTYNEFWTFHFAFDQGSQLVFNYSRANVGSLKDPVAGCDLAFLNFDGKNYDLAREYPKKNFKWDASLNKREVHKDIFFEGGKTAPRRVYLKTRKKGVDYLVDLKISQPEKGLVKGDGVYKLKGEKIGAFIHIPAAWVSGIIKINDKEYKVSGRAYMDHTYQSDTAPNLVGRGLRYFSLDGTEAGYLLFPDGKGPAMGYVLKKQDNEWKYLAISKSEGLGFAKKKDGKYLTKLKLTFDDGSTQTLSISKPKHALSILSEFSWMTKIAVKAFLGGEIVNYRGFGKTESGSKIFVNQFDVL